MVNIVQPTKSKTIDATTESHEAPGTGMKTRNAATTMTGTDATIQTRRRPQRVRVRSDMTPMIGSRNTSKNRAAPKIKPASVQPKPTSTA